MKEVASGFATFEIAPSTLQRAVEHLARLVDADSTSGREEPGVAVAEAICEELALTVHRMPAAPGRDNLLVGSSDAEVVLCTHLDTVPPHIPSTVDDVWVHGRGACDAKGIAIAMLYALRAVCDEIGPNDRAACLLVVGEETDHIGAQAAVDAGMRPRHIILGEPCGLKPAVAQKGLLKVTLTANGAAGHSAYPDCGVSAVHVLLDALHELRQAELPMDAALGETTINVGEIHGGVAANVMAPEAHASLLVRCAAPVDAVLSAIRALLPPTISIDVLSRAEPRELATLDVEAGPAVPFNTDAAWLAPTGAALTLLGPGDMRCAHAPRERLAISELRAGIETYARLVMRLL